MRSRNYFAFAGLLGVTGAAFFCGGCAQVKPCMIIPAQIELAESKRDQAKKAYEEELADVSRSQNNLDVSLGRLEKLLEERDELQSVLGTGGAQ